MHLSIIALPKLASFCVLFLGLGENFIHGILGILNMMARMATPLDVTFLFGREGELRAIRWNQSRFSRLSPTLWRALVLRTVAAVYKLTALTLWPLTRDVSSGLRLMSASVLPAWVLCFIMLVILTPLVVFWFCFVLVVNTQPIGVLSKGSKPASSLRRSFLAVKP